MFSGVAITVSELIKLRHAARGITLSSQRNVANARTGSYQSRFRGRGVDFEQVRHYLPGDDVRSMDWRVTARTGKPHTKVYREERERNVLFLVDYSASMQFGTRVAFKSVIAAQTAAILAWAALNGGDQVGGLVFADNEQQEIPSGKGQTGILPLLNALAIKPGKTCSVTSACGLVNALDHLLPVAKTGCLIFIISDFYQFDAEAEKRLGQLAQHNELAAISIYDALEKMLPAANLYTFADEQQRLLVNTSNQALVQAFTQQFEQRYTQLQHFMRQLKMPFISLATHQNPCKVLAHYWRKRA